MIGGDFYDAVLGPSGDVHAIVGDVCGHGPDEAALGALLRVSWRALVLAGVDEPQVLPKLQQVLVSERHERGLFTTVCTVADPRGRRGRRGAGPARRASAAAGARPAPRTVAPTVGLPLGILPNAKWGSLRSRWSRAGRCCSTRTG